MCTPALRTPEATESSNRIDDRRNACHPSRDRAEHYWLQRYVMNNRRALGAVHRNKLGNCAQVRTGSVSGPAPPKRNDLASRIPDRVLMSLHSRRDFYSETLSHRGSCERQPVGGEIPILGHEEQECLACHHRLRASSTYHGTVSTSPSRTDWTTSYPSRRRALLTSASEWRISPGRNGWKSGSRTAARESNRATSARSIAKSSRSVVRSPQATL